ncbi:MAG: hypothetical protein R2867_00985 [Caldilineaceae bacterium]
MNGKNELTELVVMNGDGPPFILEFEGTIEEVRARLTKSLIESLQPISIHKGRVKAANDARDSQTLEEC